jgi:hypothetical protein
MQEFYINFQGDPTVKIPWVRPDLCGKQVSEGVKTWHLLGLVADTCTAHASVWNVYEQPGLSPC